MKHEGDYWVARYESGNGELAQRFNFKKDAIEGAKQANDRAEKLGYARCTFGIWNIEWYAYTDENDRIVKRETFETVTDYVQ